MTVLNLNFQKARIVADIYNQPTFTQNLNFLRG